MKNVLTAFVHTKKVNWVQTVLLSLKLKLLKNFFKEELLCPILFLGSTSFHAFL